MPVPVFDLQTFGSAPNQYTTEQALEAGINAGFVALWNEIVAKASLTALNRLGVIPLTDIGGTANAITASISASVVADGVTLNNTSTISFTPSASNTGSPVTLFVAGDQARLLRGEDGGDIPVGYLKASRFYIAQRFGANWKIISGGATFDDLVAIGSDLAALGLIVGGKADQNALTAAITQQQQADNLGDTIRLNVAEGGTAQAITATIPAAQSHIALSAGQPVQFRWPVTNTGADPTITIGGVAYAIKRKNGGALEAADLIGGNRYRAFVFLNDPATLRLEGAAGMGDINGLVQDLTAKQLQADLTERVAQRADDRSLPLLSDGEPGELDYLFSIGDGAGGQMLGFHLLRRMIDLGFPLAFGPGSSFVAGDNAQYLLSIEDEGGNPIFAIGRDGTVHGGAMSGGGSTAGVDVEGFAAKRAADEVPILDDDEQTSIKTFTTDREMYVGTPFRGQNFASGEAGAGVDVGWLPPNGEVNIELNHDAAYIYSRIGFGGTAHNTLVRTPGVYTVVRVFRIVGRIIYHVMTGSVVESSTAPIRARSIAFGGQSHIAGGFAQGLVAGLLDGMANMQWRPGGNWMPTPVHWTPHCINGATGATAITSISQPSCWWINDTQSDGPALTTWKNRITTAVTDGQPVPEDVIWAQGEGDTQALTNGTLSLAVHWADMQAVFNEMRNFLIGLGATDPQFYIGMLGCGESSGLRARSRGYTAVRQNYLRLIAETAWVHYACELYDLPRVYNDIHYNFLGHYTHGYRYSRAVNNVRAGQNNRLGPQVTSATLEDGGRTVRLTISGGDIRMPSNPAAPWIIPAGGDAQSPGVPVTRVRTDGNDLLVTAAQDLTGCRVIYPDGAVPNPRGDSIIYDVSDVHVKMPGLPLRTFITDPLS
ncbi:hypothetical protein [Paracoccus siganidrum]|uniref:Uncharacterized protein n=1 Tax=Paracoccus siganidrum TaxID=1276757 RepID=A0A419A6D1_9RHOB|nr:hypothetical protein [Paracoccus siganidrum]RJL13684.1 hypothetical protein D3P05_11795 [Paracoccus siganidrum]RMC33437.1 hypothetical protein C9E82_13385 [Paracoccus siganidrum]